jgi:outer membrane protein OmpA-like peptidoglycan-associated protein
MKKYMFLPIGMLIIALSGCVGSKRQKSLQSRKEKTVQGIAMPLSSDNQGLKVGFFDENIASIDDLESYILDEKSCGNYLAQDELEEVNFTLQEAKQHPELATNVVYFDYDSTHMRADQKDVARNVSKKVDQWVKQGYKVVFKGHSCKWHGTRSYNLALSGKRAQYMADLCKVPKDNIKVFGVGNEEPMTFENTKEGQSENRRVEIYPIAA